MPIPNKTPLEVPASNAQTFDAIWLTDIRILAPSLTQGSVRIKHVPFDSSTGEIAHKDHTRIIQTYNIWEAAEEVPEVKVAMDALFVAVPALEAWIAEKATSVEPPVDMQP